MMKKVKIILLITIIITLIISLAFILKASNKDEVFGKYIKVLGEGKGDFNGDGLTDKLFFLAFNKNSIIEKEIQFYNPWAALYKNKKQPPFLINQNPYALGLIYGKTKKNNKNNEKIILFDSKFFSSAIWNGKQVDSAFKFSNKNGEKPLNWKKNITPRPMYILEKNSNYYKGFKKHEIPELNTDSIGLGTEDGVHILLYYYKGKYAIYWPEYD